MITTTPPRRRFRWPPATMRNVFLALAILAVGLVMYSLFADRDSWLEREYRDCVIDETGHDVPTELEVIMFNDVPVAVVDPSTSTAPDIDAHAQCVAHVVDVARAANS